MKYKLIKKLPFENSPEIGHTIDTGSLDMVCFHGLVVEPKQHPEYWEPVVEKTYEVTGFCESSLYYTPPLPERYVYRARRRDEFSRWMGNVALDKAIARKTIENNKNFTIYSVKRLSDGQEFSVGDEIKPGSSGVYKIKITGFQPTPSGDIRVTGLLSSGAEMECSISNVAIITKGYPVFLTTGYSYKPFTFIPQRWDVNTVNENVKYFETEEAAKEFITENKPCLSIKDIQSIYVSAKPHNSKSRDYYGELVNIVKSKQQ